MAQETTDDTRETPSAESTNTTQPSIEGDASEVLAPQLDAPDGGIPSCGTAEDRDAFLTALSQEGVTGSDDDLLGLADEACCLERLEAQGRSAAYVVRVVWNESLAEIDAEDLAAFGIIFNGAPHFLCPESIFYGADVACWLGY